MVIFTIVIAELLNSSLGNFLSLIGALSCTPIGFTLPTLFHYKVIAVTSSEKCIDIFIIVLSLIILVFCSAFTLYTW
jgi:proton-coupled amino acid transporter